MVTSSDVPTGRKRDGEMYRSQWHLQFLSGVGDGVGAGVGCAVGLGVGAGVAWVGSVVGFDCATARVAARRSASACSA